MPLAICRKAFIAIALSLLIGGRILGQSLVDANNSLVSGDSSFVDEGKSLAGKSSSLVNKGNTLVNKNNTLIATLPASDNHGCPIVYAAVLVVVKTTTIAALNGGAIGAVMSAAIALVQGKRGEELVYAAINRAADGYMIGAITGLVQGTFVAIRTFANAVMKGNKIFSKLGYVFDENGKPIGKIVSGSLDDVDNIVYTGLGDSSNAAFDSSVNKTWTLVERKNGYAILNKSGKVIGYITEDGKFVPKTTLSCRNSALAGG